MRNLAFVGLGAMGAPMAGALVSAGFELAVFDVRSESAEPLIGAGARKAGSPREVASGADALFLMVVDAGQAEGVLFGEDGAVGTLDRGSAVVLMISGPIR